MSEQIESMASGTSTAPALVTAGTRFVVAVAVVCAGVASVWMADLVSGSVPGEVAQQEIAAEPRLAASLPTVTVVGRRASLDEAPAAPAEATSTEVSSAASDDAVSGRVKLRQ